MFRQVKTKTGYVTLSEATYLQASFFQCDITEFSRKKTENKKHTVAKGKINH